MLTISQSNCAGGAVWSIVTRDISAGPQLGVLTDQFQNIEIWAENPHDVER